MGASKQLIMFDPKVQLLANHLLTGSSVELMPTIHPELGVRYVEAERITGDEPAAVTRWLVELAAKGVLKGRFVSKLVMCPKCDSHDAPIYYCCPSCRSTEIEKKALFEHLACGVIDKEDNFKKGDKLICPRCSRQLGGLGITHKAVGTWFLCRSCGRNFERPHSFHVCSNCKNSFVVEDAVLVDVLAYSLSEDAATELRSGSMFLKPLDDVLESAGYKVIIGGVLHGASGTDHRFDLVGTRENAAVKESIVVDVVSSDGVVEDSSVTNMFAKRYDTNPDKSVLVVIPTIHNSGRKLAALYKIILIEAASARDAVDKLKLSLSS